MAFTKDEHDNLLKLIAESGGATDNMMEAIQRLRDDYDERIGMETSDGGEWQTKYDELKTKYIDRFFSGSADAAAKEMDTAIVKNNDDVKKDGEKLSFEKLFEKRED